MLKHISIITLFCTIILSGYTQNINGSWYGVGTAETDKVGNNYLTELNLLQNGNKITGVLNFYFRDSLFSNKITGTINQSTRIIDLSVGNIIFFKSTNTSIGVDCPMNGKFQLRVAKTESVLTGSLYSKNSYRFTCPSIILKLKKEKANNSVDENISITKNEEKPTDSSIIHPISAITETKIVTPEEKITQEGFIKREKTYSREIEITGNDLKLEFYDNGSIDGDSIAVFFNNQLVLPKSLLNHRAIRFSVKYNDQLPFNELSMFAESLGAIPPNTAALIIYDGNIRHEVLMTSDFNKSSTIKLMKKKLVTVQ